MLVLSRKPGEKVIIGNGITVTVVEVHGNRVRIGIDAPGNVRILREELAFWREKKGSGVEETDADTVSNEEWSEAEPTTACAWVNPD